MSNARTLLSLLKKGDAAEFAAAIAEAGNDALQAESFVKLSLSYASFDGLDLSNTEWEECMIEGASFRNSDLQGAYLNGCTFIDCVFEDLDAEAASIDGTTFKGCQFRRADLTESEVTGAEFTDCGFDGVVLDSAEWNAITIAGGTWEAVTADEATLQNVVMRDVSIVAGVTFKNATLTRCMTNGDKPDGFERLSGKRKRIL